MSIIKSAFCSKLSSEFDSRMRILRSTENQLNSSLNSLKFSIKDIDENLSPFSVLGGFRTSVNENLKSLVPELSDFDELTDLINSCLFTKNDPMLSKPSVITRGIRGFIRDGAFSVMQQFATIGDNIIPEFNAAKLIHELKWQMGGLGLNFLVPEAMQALNCASAICGTDISIKLSTLNNFINGYYLNSNGELNVEVLLQSQNITSTAIEQINYTYEQVQSVMTNIDSSVDQGISRVKDLIPDLDLD